MKKMTFGINLSLLGISIVLLAAAANQFFVEHLNSDYLYLFEVVTNVIHNKTLAGQDVPAAPYYFPDLAVLFFLNLFTHHVALLHFLYSFLFVSTFIFIIFILFNTSIKNPSLSILGTLIVVASYFFLIMPAFYFLQDWPGSHLSVVLFSLAFLCYYIKILQKPPTFVAYGCLFILTFFIFISDNLLFAQFLLPFSILIIVDRIRSTITKKQAYSLLTLFFLVVILGAKIDIVFEKMFDITYSNNVSLFRIRKWIEMDKTFALAAQLFVTAFRLNPITFFLLFFYNLITIILSGLLFFSNAIQCNRVSLIYANRLENLLKILIFCYAAQISNIILAILAGKFTAVAYLRYLDVIFIFPSITLALILIHILDEKKLIFLNKKVIELILISGFIVFICNYFLRLKKITFLTAYNDSIQCIDQLQSTYSIKNGVGEFWSVRPVRMLSKRGVHLSQINKNLNFINFADNKAYFYSNLKIKTPYRYQFIIVNGLPKDKIIKEIGRPDHIAMCPEHELWLYLKNENKLNTYFLKKIKIFV